MARKVSNDRLERLRSEGGSRIITRTRPEPEVAPSVTPEPVEAPSLPTLDVQELAAALQESNRQLLADVKQPKIKRIRIENIERDGDSRIDSADFSVTYEDS